ncbi:MAG: methyltransferase domain-containing protein, partial [Bacteroidota bacterium]
MAARKKTLKKTEFESFENCFPKTSQTASTWAAWFQNDHPLHLELGCGKAEFSYALSSLFPEKNYVGVDLKPDRLWKPAKDALAEGRKNIALVCGNLLHLDQYVAENEADEIWITFPDPFPKKRHIKHRMVNPPFLA